MTSSQPNQEAVIVTEADREAAMAMRHEVARQLRAAGVAISVVRQPADDSEEVKAFARHRIKSADEAVRAEREAAQKLVRSMLPYVEPDRLREEADAMEGKIDRMPVRSIMRDALAFIRNPHTTGRSEG